MHLDNQEKVKSDTSLPEQNIKPLLIKLRKDYQRNVGKELSRRRAFRSSADKRRKRKSKQRRANKKQRFDSGAWNVIQAQLQDGLSAEEVLEPILSTRTRKQLPRAVVTPPVSGHEQTNSKALLVIESDAKVPKYVVCEDVGKGGRIGFIGGRKEPTDKGILATGVREAEEEAGLKIELGKDNYFSRLFAKNDQLHSEPFTIFLLHCIVPANTKLSKGKGQEQIWWATRDEIEDMILCGQFLPKHVEAWEEFKEWRF